MKKLFNLTLVTAFLCLTIVGCKKNSPEPEPIVNNSNSTASTLSAMETSLLGNWAYDKQQLYSNGVALTSTGGMVTYNDPAVYHIRFNSTVTTGTYKECINGTSGSDITTNWEVTSSGKLFIQSTSYTIDSVSSAFLSYHSGSLTSGGGVQYSFHKL